MLKFNNNKRGLILEGALSAFLVYGFKKTSMNDIADRAGVSRPALYQLFKSKTDIYRALSEDVSEFTVATMKACFKRPETLRDQLKCAIEKTFVELYQIANESPHGHELLELKHEIAQDIEANWKRQMVDAIAAGINQAVSQGKADMGTLPNMGIDAQTIATIFMDAMTGIRDECCNSGVAKERALKLIDFIAATIAAKPTVENFNQPARHTA